MKSTAIASALIAILLLGSEASACSWYETCKTKVHHVVKVESGILSKKLEMRVAENEKRLADLEDREKGHVKTITLLHQQLVTLQIQINALRQQNQAH